MADKDLRVGIYSLPTPAKPSGSILLDFWWWAWRLGLLFLAMKLLSVWL